MIEVELPAAMLKALAMVDRKPVRRGGSPWGIPYTVATALLDAAMIEPGTERSLGIPSHTWRTWKITEGGREPWAWAGGDAA